MRHNNVKELLYEYLNGELEQPVKVEVDTHLAGCESCRTELQEIQFLLDRFPIEQFKADEKLPAGYWNSFASSVERRIEEADERQTKRLPAHRPRRIFSIGNMIDHMFFTPRPYLTAFGGALAILLCFVLVWRWLDRPTGPVNVATNTKEVSPYSFVNDTTATRLRQYVSRSKMLLVGISNMKPIEGTSTYDLSVERQKSRELVHEARFLKNQPLDSRSQKLIADLERILIELANMKEEGNAPNVEIIRGGLHQENLLFKIRMEEQTLSPQHDSPVTY